MNKATTVSDIRSVCDIFPIDKDDLQNFYVDTALARGADVLADLKCEFENNLEAFQHVLFIGHIGSGKSTLLYQLERHLRSSYKILRFSVQEHLDTETISFSDLLFLMYERVITKFKDELNDSENLKVILENWNAIVTKTQDKELESEISVESEIGCGVKNSLFQLFAKLKSSFKAKSKNKEIICNTININITDHIEELNTLFSEVSNDKPLLLIFEDLEKISPDAAIAIFKNYGCYFKHLKANLLLTTPILLKYNTEFKNIISTNFTSDIRCPIIAVKNPDGTENTQGIKTLCDIVYNRMDKRLIEETVLKEAVLNSGGVIRDLLFLLSHAAKHCSSPFIQLEDIQFAFQSLQEKYCDGLRINQVEAVKRILENPFSLIQDEEELLLMKSEVIIEYNCKQWRGVHPAVTKFLDDRGYFL